MADGFAPFPGGGPTSGCTVSVACAGDVGPVTRVGRLRPGGLISAFCVRWPNGSDSQVVRIPIGSYADVCGRPVSRADAGRAGGLWPVSDRGAAGTGLGVPCGIAGANHATRGSAAVSRAVSVGALRWSSGRTRTTGGLCQECVICLSHRLWECPLRSKDGGKSFPDVAICSHAAQDDTDLYRSLYWRCGLRPLIHFLCILHPFRQPFERRGTSTGTNAWNGIVTAECQPQVLRARKAPFRVQVP